MTLRFGMYDRVDGLVSVQSARWRDEFFYEHRFTPPPGFEVEIPRSEGVRTSRYKYLRYLDREGPNEQLFDLWEDPREERNLALVASEPLLAAMRERTRRLRSQVR